MQDILRDAYQDAPYESKPITGTHVGSLETMAFLHGMHPPSCDRARVLELGCATGGNIIGMAYQFPESRFVGIDLAPNQIADGVRAIQALGLSNVELYAKSIADIGDDFGEFDYVICHGVYSWVPPEVQDAILRVCSRNLTPNGVAYVSYNVYPGWHLRAIVRDMLRFHDDPSLSPPERVTRARRFAQRIADAANADPSVSSAVMTNEVEAVRRQTDAHLLHEQLEPFNAPVYFTEFMRHAASHRLRFVCEAVQLGLETQLVERAKDVLGDAVDKDAADVIRAQQYTDFMRGRKFRATLLCHDSVTTRERPSADLMYHLHFSMRGSHEEPSAEDAAKGGTVEAFRSIDGGSVSTNNPVIVAALRALLRASPGALSFADLLGRVADRLSAEAVPGLPGAPEDMSELASSLATALLQCMLGALVDVGRHPSGFVPRVSDRPRASAVTRLRASTGLVVPNLQHGHLEISPIEQFVLAHLDGTKTRDDLLDVLVTAAAVGTLATDDEHRDRTSLASALDSILKRFAYAALLEA